MLVAVQVCCDQTISYLEWHTCACTHWCAIALTAQTDFFVVLPLVLLGARDLA